jgi:hypothetical protein
MLKAISTITNAIGALNYKGTWNASTNSPALASGVGTKGDYYVVSVAGSTNLDGETLWGVGDWAAFNGAAWQKVEGGNTINATTVSATSVTTTGNINVGAKLGINKATPTYGLDYVEGATSTTQRMATSSAAAGECVQLFEVANNFSGISQSFVKGIGPGGSGVSQLAFGVSITSGAATATDVARFDTSGNFRPSADNAYSCGTAALRWSVIYSATALINTSDASTKTVIGGIDEAEKRVAQRIKAGIKKYQLNNSIAEKGNAARIHWGVIAQDVKAAFEVEGLNAEQYSMFCSDSWFEKDGERVLDENGEIMTSGDTPEGAVKITRLGIRYEELFAFIIASL